MDRRSKTIITAITAVHLIALIAHGGAHMKLAIPMPAWHGPFILGVIWIAPVLATILLWTRFQIPGLALFVTSMAASFLFGMYYHFAKPGPDHVSSIAPDTTGIVFTVSAAMLAAVEGIAFTAPWLTAKHARN